MSTSLLALCCQSGVDDTLETPISARSRRQGLLLTRELTAISEISLARGKAQHLTTRPFEDSRVRRLEQQALEQTQTIGSSAEDTALVSAVLRKDRKATAEFVDRYSDDIYRYVRSRLAPRYELADDLLQEIFLAAWESLSRYRATGSLQAWIMGIARHKVEDYYRERLRTPESFEDVEREPEPAISAATEIHKLLEQDQLRKNTQRVLAELPERYRLALIWRYWDKTSAREMALKMGKTEKAIERLLARARAEFRERWNHGQSS